ncbi:hypothetical protein CAEBREN_13977 [Caenorhabditis brenneri]|uniref:Uncharacterized protein n=1 Tax=Caenorhabditis brenneri TaxID=135651 RepID=G0MLA8_CAEBE|nr:hypothetical protein CAEBREN_13977 [Caenorhabditis brenneri]
MMAPSTEDPETVVEAQRRGSFSKKKNGSGWTNAELVSENGLAKSMDSTTGENKSTMEVDEKNAINDGTQGKISLFLSIPLAY